MNGIITPLLSQCPAVGGLDSEQPGDEFRSVLQAVNLVAGSR